MINITALKRHVSTDSETVGGPCQVLSILIVSSFSFVLPQMKDGSEFKLHLEN